jgi:hypothetical protein
MEAATNKTDQQEGVPLIIRLSKPTEPDPTIYDHAELYNQETQMLDPGTYFMGSPKANTRCNGFTIFGADKTHADDTKEKKR